MNTNLLNARRLFTNVVRAGILTSAAMVCLLAERSNASTATVFSEDFESYTDVATSLADTNNANPTNPFYALTDDAPVGNVAGSGVQVINWMSHGGSKALLMRPGTTLTRYLTNALSGPKYQFDIWVYVVREATSDRNYRINLSAEGSDNNGDDFLAYRVVNTAGSTALQYYDGVNGAGAWVTMPNPAAVQNPGAWQHHRLVMNPNTLTFDLYLDDMTTPVLAGADISRGDTPVIVRLQIVNEGNTADDGYFVVDDLSLTVDGSIDLSTTFTEGFEAYTARTSDADDADPAGPWVTTEMDRGGNGRFVTPAKVQIVDASVVTPHSGSKCLKLEYGQRASATIGWGVLPDKDVQITWWARVPASPTGAEYNYLRMSLYGVESGNNTFAGDCALIGYACRSGTIGRPTSLTYYTTGWVDSGVDFTPDTWEEYRMTTHNGVGLCTIVKNPSSASPVVIAKHQIQIGTGPFSGQFIAAWSSSNGTNHPPVYVDDIEIKAVNASPDASAAVYKPEMQSSRFTNYTMINAAGPVRTAIVDPRDNKTILFAINKAGGGIYKATKVASGNWAIDSTPIVSGLDYVAGMTIANDGALWWVHDNAMSARRLKWPWTNNTPEIIISDFGMLSSTNTVMDDDPFDICVAPSGFTGSIGNTSDLVIMDRGVDDNPWNALSVVDSATTLVNQTNYQRYLFPPSNTGLGTIDLVALTPFPPNEVATICLDGQVTAVDASGNSRSFWPAYYSDTAFAIQPSAMSVDPTAGKLWFADDLTNQIWSCSTADGSSGACEVSFVLTNSVWPELQIDFAEPGMSFSKDGKILVVADSGNAAGQGRLIIFHNEAFMPSSFPITSYSKTASGFQLNWQSAGSATYRVQRTTDLKLPMVDITGDLTVTTFTDTNVPGGAFYRVVAKP